MARKHHPEWPAMRYHPTTGQPRVFSGPDEVPEGWVDNLAKVGKPQPKTDGDKLTLKDLGVTRKEAIAFLKEEGQDVNPKISNAELAKMVEPFVGEE